jgi:cyclic pyranopterin phosphate synthase
MNKRVIPIADERNNLLHVALRSAADAPAAEALLLDQRLRPLRDLRISVTDRCNFRCSYCMPKEVFTKDYSYLPHAALLTFEEIVRLAKVFLGQGVQKIRLTGGEPLLRKNIEDLVLMLMQLRTTQGEAPEITLTTNGALLAKKAQALRDAGLSRVTVSLDALDDAVFRRMNDVDFPVNAVLEGIAAAKAAGFGRPGAALKVNMVVKRGVNDQEIVPMAKYFRGTGVTLRYIEFMDVGATNGWRMDDVVPSKQVIERLAVAYPLVALEPSAPGETAQRWGYAAPNGKHDPAAGEIGVISSVSQAFCSDCNRARISTEGRLFLCLFAGQGYDLKQILRNTNIDSSVDETLAAAIRSIWQGRRDNYSEQRANGEATRGSTSRVEMSYIGG